MDFVTLLRRDHERVSSLFSQIQSGFEQPDTPERHRLFRQLKRELDLHAADTWSRMKSVSLLWYVRRVRGASGGQAGR